MRDDLLPRDHEAEAIVLGSAILNQQHLDALVAECSTAHFHVPLHASVFGALAKIHGEGRQATLARVVEHCGGKAAEIAALIDGLPRLTDLDRWVRPLKDKALLRALIRTARTVEEEALVEGAEGAAVLDRAQSALVNISRIGTVDGFVDNAEATKRALVELERMAESIDGIYGLGSGLIDLDRAVGGFRGGDLVLIGAETSGGKSALALQIAEFNARQGKSVAMFSLEMSDVALFVRRICAEAKVSTEFLRFKRGEELNRAWDRILKAVNEIVGRRLWIDPSSYQTIAQLTTRARRKQLESGLDLVVVDYIQLVHGVAGKSYDTRAVEMGDVAYGLLGMAKDLNVPVIAPVQFNRGVAARPDRRPRMSDLKESSALEQACDVGILIWHEDQKGKFADPDSMSTAELIVDKNRRGRKGVATVRFNKFLSRFEDAAREDVDWDARKQ